MVKGRHKTGGGGGPWVEYDSPKPPPVEDHYDLSTEASGVLSERAQWWLRQIERGWRPSRRVLNCCWDCNSEWLGVYGWEYIDHIRDALWPPPPPKPVYEGPKTLLDTLKDMFMSEMKLMLDEEIDRVILYGEGS